MANVMHFPDKGPYAPENEDLPDPGEGMVLSAFPHDQKYMDDPAWYDSLGRTLIEQRKILTAPRSEEERVEMVKKALEDAEEFQREMDAKVEMDAEGDMEMQDDEAKETREKRLWSIALEVAIKGSGAVMQYLVREKGLNAKTAPPRIDGMVVEIQLSSYHGYLDVVKVLVEEANVDTNREADGQTPLSQAAIGGRTEVVKYLLDHGADLVQSVVFGSAAVSGNVEVMKILFEAVKQRESQNPVSDVFRSHALGGADTSASLLGAAAESTSVEMLRLVLEQGGYGMAIDNSEAQRRDAIMAICMCVRNDKTNMTCLETVIDCAIPRDASGSFVRSDDDFLIEELTIAIENATDRAKSEDVRKLLHLVLDATTLTREDERFRRILDRAIHRCYDQKTEPCAIELLENWGANPNTNNANDKRDPYPTPLAPAAVSRGKLDWVRFWLDHGADIHRAHGPYCNGPTALALATTIHRNEGNRIVRELLDRGGPIDKMDDDLLGKKTLYVDVYGSELNSVELTAAILSEGNDTGKRDTTVLTFPDGISEAWLRNIQYRRPDAELAQDGTGRPRKGRRHT